MGVSNQDKANHKTIGETLAEVNPLVPGVSPKPDGGSEEKKSSHTTGHEEFADEKVSKQEVANKLHHTEQPMAKTLAETNSAVPVVGGTSQNNASGDSIKDAATRDPFANSDKLHDEQKAKLMSTDKPMDETLKKVKPATKYI
jgi:hypothetical protein